VEPGYFQWISVGDSHIYLYRGSQLLLLNREHIYEAELLQQAVNGEISFGEVKKHPKRKGLTSFIGMGELKHIDGSSSRIPSQKGDWLLLMSDGVFNTVPEADICQILSQAGNAEVAARQLEDEVLRRQNPKQDNFTAIILEL
jgi:serine/threonine protein phosphatase PrpC